MDDLATPLPHEVPAEASEPGTPTPASRQVRRGRRGRARWRSPLPRCSSPGQQASAIGYSAVRGLGQGPAGSSSSSAGSTGRQELSSSQQLPPGYSCGGYGQYAGPDRQASPTDPFAEQSLNCGSSSGTDATSKASGSRLTGLVRIVSTMEYDGGKAAGTSSNMVSG